MNAPVQPAAPILNYQRQRTLDQVPAYAVGLQLRLRGGDRVYLACSSTELTLYFQNDRALHYDLEGRLVKMAEPHQYWRRSCSHRVVHSRKRAADQGGGLERVLWPEDAADRVVAEALRAVQTVAAELADGAAKIEFGKPNGEEARPHVERLLQRAARFDVAAARSDADRFRQIYGRVAVLPPDEYNALVLQATQGCAYDHCAFCQLYRGVAFHARNTGEFRAHIRAVADYHGESLRSRRALFLGEANALTLPQETLVAHLELIREVFELPSADAEHVPASWWLGSRTRFDGVASFLDCFSGTPRTVAEYEELRRRGLRRVYIGLESGDDALLKWLRKPATSATVISVVRTLKAARINVGVIVLLGAGGQRFALSHARETSRVLNELGLARGDYVYFSPLVVHPGGLYDTQARAQNVVPLTPTEIHEQEQTVRAGLHFSQDSGRPYVARYELELFAY